MRDPHLSSVIQQTVSYYIWSIQLRLLLLPTCGSAPCACVLLGCLLQTGLLPPLKVSVLCQAEDGLQDQSLKSLLWPGCSRDVAMLSSLGQPLIVLHQNKYWCLCIANLFAFMLFRYLEMTIRYRLLLSRLTRLTYFSVLNLSRIILSKRRSCAVMFFLKGCIEHWVFSGCSRLGWFCSLGAGE